MLLYDYQYNIAAVLVTILLLIVFLLRHSYTSRANTLFLLIILCDMIAAILDLISCFTISFPQDYPLWLNYGVSLGYLLFYNTMALLYLLYVDVKAKVAAAKKPVFYLAHLLFLYYCFAILSSPWTHLVAYFDENLVYCHGPLMSSLYIIPFFLFGMEMVLFIKGRKNFNTYQLLSSYGLVFGMSASVLVTIIIPRALIGQLFMAVIMIFIYIAFENPAHHTYRDTQCFSIHAFNEFIKQELYFNRPFDLICFYIRDYDELQESLSFDQLDHLNIRVADMLYMKFRKKIFCLADGKYVLLLQGDYNLDEVELRILSTFEKPIDYGTDSIKLQVHMDVINDLDPSFSAVDVTTIVNYRLNMGASTLASVPLLQMLRENQIREQKMLRSIQNAIANKSFEVYYQPIMHLESGIYQSAEALIRLEDAELGFLNPEEMIVLAEKNGLICEVGEIVFEKVCKMLSENNLGEKGLRYIEINISPLQFRRASIISEYLSIMNRYHVQASQLNFEITETAEITDEHRIMNTIIQFFMKGVSFSIDDYGSGFASLDYLIKLPVDLIKIDKSILWAAMKSSQAMIVLQNTIKMVKQLGKKLVVEGIENEEMAKMLLELGVDYNQGFYYSKPLPEEEFVAFIQSAAH